MRETWYVLETGIAADPNACAPDEYGVLRHVSGVPVAMRGQAYSSQGIDDADSERARIAATNETAKDEVDGKVMRPVDGVKRYRTRESKAR